MSYEPPFNITAKSINLISEISAAVERVKINFEKEESLKLRKVNRMKTIRGSLAIEGNSLTEEQVTALIDGKHVIAPVKEVQEVRNAIKAYENFDDFDAYNWKDLLKAHGIMALGLVDNPGHFRKGGVCVAGKEGVSHIAPPAHMVQGLMADLFNWLKNAEDHVLIKSCVFHYEFEFIHPFEDGNGRMGRFWQSKILSEWNPIFANLPIENMIWENQAEYYKSIELSTHNTDSGIFVEFMLVLILNALKSHVAQYGDSLKHNDPINDLINDPINLFDLIKQNPNGSYEDYAKKLNVSSATIKRKIAELKAEGKIVREGSNKNGFWKVEM